MHNPAKAMVLNTSPCRRGAESTIMPSLIMWAAILFDVGFAIFHVMFWYLFGWPARLRVSGGINTAITQTLNAMLIYVLGLYAAALLWHATASERAPAMLLLAGASFWLVRAAAQPVLFRIGRGTSAAFAMAFLAGAGLHGWAAMA